jgi:hypothetical protein
MRSVIGWDWYRDPRVLEVEERRLFRPSWQYVGPLECLRQPGWIEQMMAFDTEVGDQDAVLVAAAQAGVAGSWIDRGRILPQERLLAGFQRYVHAACAAEVPAGLR